MDSIFEARFFPGAGKPLLPRVESAGAEIYSRYHITEIGYIGHGRRRMRIGNSVHVYRDAIAVISHKRLAPLCDAEVNSLMFTTLLPCAPRVLINVEMD